MELQRAPYLKNLKRKSDMDKFIRRRNERSISAEESIVERLIGWLKAEVRFEEEYDLISEALNRIKKDSERVIEQAQRIDELESRESEMSDERDCWERKATELASNVGIALGFEVGEHSSANCPVQNAMDEISHLRD